MSNKGTTPPDSGLGVGVPDASTIRVYGDPVLKTLAASITNIDGKLVSLAENMLHIMYEAPGLGLAGPQIGVQKQIFVYDVDDDPQVILNPTIVESSGEWVYDEGCLSIPGLFVEMLRPKEVLVRGLTLEGDEIEVEADELLARLFQHEIDHLQGVLMFDRMLPDQRKIALNEYQKHEKGPKNSEPVHVRLT
jgi:peptide deformylase